MTVGQTVALRSGVTTHSEGGGLCILSTNVASIWLGVSHIFPCDSDSLIVTEGRVWGVGLERVVVVVVVVVVGTQKQEECYILYSLTDLLWILISVLVCSQAASNKGS